MQIQALDHLVLTVADIQTSVNFYCTILGMQHRVFGDGRHALTFGQQKINLHQVNNIFLPAANSPAPGSADLCFLINTDIEETIKALNNAGVTIIEGPVERTGATGKILSVYIRDPDRNLIELAKSI